MFIDKSLDYRILEKSKVREFQDSLARDCVNADLSNVDGSALLNKKTVCREQF